MPDSSTLVIVVLASLALAVVPGPAVLYIVTRSISQGRAAGMASVVGIHLGTLVHIAAAVLGLSALIVRSALAFNAMKYAGAAYLVYLGIRSLRDKRGPEAHQVLQQDPLSKIFRRGLVVNLLNVKTGLFFLAFLPQFVQPGRGDVATQMFALGIVFMVVAFLSDVAYAAVASRLSGRLRSSAAFARRQKVFSGTMYIALGASAALSGGRSSS